VLQFKGEEKPDNRGVMESYQCIGCSAQIVSLSGMTLRKGMGFTTKVSSDVLTAIDIRSIENIL